MAHLLSGLRRRAGQTLNSSGAESRLARGIGGTAVLRIGNTGLVFLTNFLLARLLSVDEFGVYNFAFAWVTLLIVPAVSGFDRLLIRSVAVYRSQAAWRFVRGLIRVSTRLTLLLGLGIMVIAAGVAWFTYETTGRPAWLHADQAPLARTALITLLIALLLLPLRSILLLQQAEMQGLRHVVVGQVPEQALQHVLFVLVLGLALAAGIWDSAPAAMVLHVLTTVAALGYSASLLRQAIPVELRGVSPAYDTRQWTHSAVLFGVARALLVMNMQIGVLMVGAMQDAEAVALFSVALRLAALIVLMLLSVNMAVAPTLAQFYADGEHDALQHTMTQSARVALVGALAVLIPFLLWGDVFLRLFGPEFGAARRTLTLLSIGQVVNAATGSVGLLLMMTRHEGTVLVANAIGLALHVGLNLLLIPLWGIEGAAVSSTVGLAFVNLFLMGMVWKELDIHTTALGVIRWWKSRVGGPPRIP